MPIPIVPEADILEVIRRMGPTLPVDAVPQVTLTAVVSLTREFRDLRVAVEGHVADQNLHSPRGLLLRRDVILPMVTTILVGATVVYAFYNSIDLKSILAILALK